MSDLSLLWAAEDSHTSFAQFRFVKNLRLDDLIRLRAGMLIGGVQDDLSAYFSVNQSTLARRRELFAELLQKHELYGYLKNCFSTLSEFFKIQAEKDSAMSAEQLLYSIKELESYVDFLRGVKATFEKTEVKSRALRELWQVLEPLCTGESFDALCAAVAEQNHVIRNLKSISIGINLSPQLIPEEAGVIAIHEREFESGDLIPRLLSLNVHKDEFTCAAPLLPMEKRLSGQEMAALRASINAALNKVLMHTLKSWSGVVKKYVVANLGGLRSAWGEWDFVESCMDAMLGLRQAGYGLCSPVMGDTDVVEGLYHPILALTARDDGMRTVVKNSLRFDSEGRIFILTGANQGGKSIYSQSVGILYAMLHLGMLLPADSATLCPVDAILTHFVDIHQSDYRHGRLAAECNEIHQNNQDLTQNSLFLYDEALSSTNAAEAVVISKEILTAYAKIGARGIWTTHFHDLCRLDQEIVGEKSSICNLSAQIEQDSHRRLFGIVRGDGYAQSYASDIASRYHLTADEILAEKSVN